MSLRVIVLMLMSDEVRVSGVTVIKTRTCESSAENNDLTRT